MPSSAYARCRAEKFTDPQSTVRQRANHRFVSPRFGGEGVHLVEAPNPQPAGVFGRPSVVVSDLHAKPRVELAHLHKFLTKPTKCKSLYYAHRPLTSRLHVV